MTVTSESISSAVPVSSNPVKTETFSAEPAPSASQVLNLGDSQGNSQEIKQAAPQDNNTDNTQKDDSKPSSKEDVSAVRFAELSKRAKEQYRKEQELKQLEEKLSPINQALSKAKENPLAILEAAGLSYEDLTDFILNDALTNQQKAPKELTVEEKVAQLELKLKAEEEAKALQAKQQEQALIEESINSFTSTVKELASTNPEFELIHTTEQHDMVYDLVLAHFEKSGEVLPVTDAMKLVEDYLLQEIEQKALKANKIRQKLMVESPQPKSQVINQAHKPAAPKVTLSNSMTPQTSAQPSQKISPEEARARALAMLKFS